MKFIVRVGMRIWKTVARGNIQIRHLRPIAFAGRNIFRLFPRRVARQAFQPIGYAFIQYFTRADNGLRLRLFKSHGAIPDPWHDRLIVWICHGNCAWLGCRRWRERCRGSRLLRLVRLRRGRRLAYGRVWLRTAVPRGHKPNADDGDANQQETNFQATHFRPPNTQALSVVAIGIESSSDRQLGPSRIGSPRTLIAWAVGSCRFSSWVVMAAEGSKIAFVPSFLHPHKRDVQIAGNGMRPLIAAPVRRKRRTVWGSVRGAMLIFGKLRH